MTQEASTEPTTLPQTRRRLLIAAGGAAAAGGLGLGWWRTRVDETASALPASFWQLEFDRPMAEAPLQMSAQRGRPVLINFWATWCPPCVEELPLINSFFLQNLPKGWQVIGLAVDQPSAVRSFLTKIPLAFEIGMAGLNGTDLSKSLGNISGSLPFSVVIGAKGGILARKLGRLTQVDLNAWAQLA